MATYSAGSASIAIRPDLRDFRRRIKSQLKSIDVDFPVDVSPDMDAFAQKVNAGLSAVDDRLDIEVQADTAVALGQLQTLTRDRNIDVDVDVDTAAATAQVAALQGQVTGLGSSLGMIGLYSGVIGGIGALASGAVAPVTSLAGGLVSMSGSLLVLPGILAAAGGGLAAVLTGVSGLGDAFSEMNGDAEKFNEALAELSPNAAEFVRSVKGVSDEWSGLQDTVQNSLFTGLGDGIEQFTEVQLPGLERGLSDVNAEINDGLRSTIGAFSTELAAADMSTVLDNTARSVDGLSYAAEPLSQIWMDLSTVGSEYLPDMSRNLGLATQRWSAMISEARRTGELNEIIDGGLAAVDRFAEGMSDAGGIIVGVYTAADQVGQPMISTLGTALDLTNQWVNSVEGQESLVNFFTTTSDAVSDLAPSLGTVASVLVGDLIPGVAGFISGAAPGFTKFVDSLADGLAGAPETLSSLGEGFGDVLGSVAPLSPVLGTAVDLLGEVGPIISTASAPLELVAGLLGEHPELVLAAAAAWGAYKIVPGVVDRVSSSITRVKDAARPAATEMRDVGTSFSEAYAYARQAHPEMSRFGAAMTVVGGQGGVASAALGGVNRGFSSLLDTLGGGWGVGIMAVGTVISGVASASRDADEAQEALSQSSVEAAAAQDELADAAAGTTGALNDQGLAAAAKLADAELTNLVNTGEHMSGFWADFTGAAPGLEWWETAFFPSEVTKQKMEEARETGEAFSALEGVAGELGISMDEMGRIAAEGGPEFDRLVTAVRGVEDGGELAAGELERVRSEVEKSIEAARQLDPGMREAADAVAILADESSSAGDKLGALNEILQIMGLAPKDAERAMRDAAESVAEMSQEIVDLADDSGVLGDALIGANGAIDTTTENGRALWDQLDELGSTLQNVAANGGDTQAVFEDMQPNIQALADEFGLTKEQVLELGESFGLVPDTLDLVVALEGADEATQELFAVSTRMEDVPPGKTIRMEALTDDAVEALEGAGYSVDKIPGSKHVNVSAETEHAKQRLYGVLVQMADLDGVEVSPTVLMNTTPLEGSAQHAQGILDALDIQTPTPQAQIIIDQLTAGVDISQGQLDYLASQTPTPLADLNKTLLESGVSVSHEMLNALQARPTTPVLDANGQPLYSAVDGAKGKMNELTDKTVTITTVHHRIDYWTQQGYSPEEAASVQGPVPVGQTGGRLEENRFNRLPAFEQGGQVNRGYRLPKTGPGTEIVDGFLGVDNSGMPVARVNRGEWVINERRSEEYDRELAAINAGIFPKLEGYEDGGRVGGVTAGDLLAFARGQNVRGQQASRSLEGAPYVWGGVNWGDCSGAMAAIARFATGLDAFAGRFATMNQRQALDSLGFRRGLGGPGDFSIGWYNGGNFGGHTSGTIAGTNVEMGGGRGNGQIGGNAAPASHSQYTDHAHLPLGIPMRSESTTVYGADSASEPLGAGAAWEDPMVSPPSGYRVGNSGSGSGYSSSRSSRSDSPTSWSEVAGIGASAWASGMVGDALGVFGIPDSPAWLDAYGQWQDATAAPEQGRTIRYVDDADVADLERDLATAQEELRIEQIKLGEMDEKTKESTRASAELRLKKQEQDIADLERELAEARTGGLYKINDDGTLGSEVDQPVGPTIHQQQQAALGNIQDQLMEAVVGRIPTSNVPDAVEDPLRRIAGDLGIPLRLATGGSVFGPGGPVADAIPALLSDREFVTRSLVADQARPLLEQMNADPAFARALNDAVATPNTTRKGAGGPTYVIQSQSVDEGIRKAEMMERRRVAAMGLR